MSRSTFRSAQHDVAWQRQLRDRYADEGAPDVDLSLKRGIVRPVSRTFAEQIILKYEWLGTMSHTRYHYGLFFGPYCAGVTCVGSSAGTAGTNVAASLGVTPQQLRVLARGACVHWAPTGANSKLVALTCKLLARDKTAKIVIAYSDTDAGEIGTIYQACNWTYIGPGASTLQFVAPTGKVYDGKLPYNVRNAKGLLDKVTWKEQRDALLRAGYRQQKSNPKHRYVYILDRSDTILVERIERMRRAYPKRAKHPSDAPAVQAGEGGAAPTRTLPDA